MSRVHFLFSCGGARLVATLDEAPEATGLLLVSGGNEVRAGAWNGQTRLAARIAEAGFPVLRFDRRGVGDSEGVNREYRESGEDIAAALAAFRERCPWLTRVVAFGNCDAASALMLNGGEGLDGLILSNPWTLEAPGAGAATSPLPSPPPPPPPEVLRHHYRQRLADPAALRRLVTGEIGLRGLAASLLQALRPARPPAPAGLAQDMARGLTRFSGQVLLLIAERDRAGRAFLAAWNKADPRLRVCAGASHSYAEPHARDWLVGQVLEQLGG